MELIYQLITMETKFNLRNERQYAPHFYWVGLKYGDTYYSSTTDHNSMYINYILKCAKELHATSPSFMRCFALTWAVHLIQTL